MEKSTTAAPIDGGKRAFHTTHWTVVLQAASAGSAESNEAFGKLYLNYWYPLYTYVRRRGYSPHDAEDITQNFFTRLLEKKSLAAAAPEAGRFRSFLLTSLSHFVNNEWDRARAQKRGGGAAGLSLDAVGAETRYAASAVEPLSPETAFEQNWTLTLLDHVFERLRAECQTANRGALFDELRLHIQGDKHGPPYAEIAARQGTNEGAIRVFAHRLRRRYGELLRQEIARTVATSKEVEEELRHLISVVSR